MFVANQAQLWPTTTPKFERASAGLSYGMQEVIGRGSVHVNPLPGVQLQVLALDAPGLPALGFGFDSQGRGRWLDDRKRYERKAYRWVALSTARSNISFRPPPAGSSQPLPKPR